MNRKPVIIFWGVETTSDDPVDFDNKRSVYLDFATSLHNKGCDVYICKGYNRFLGANRYMVNWKYTGESFIRHQEIVEPIKVWDVSGKVVFPLVSSTNVLNTVNFKLFCKNKFVSYKTFPEFFKPTFILGNNSNIERVFDSNPGKKWVLKPVNGSKGNGIVFVKDKSDIKEVPEFHDYQYLMQEMIDTKEGIPGLVDGVHDLRIVIINNEIVWSHIRIPPEGSLKANVAGGGSINEIDPQKIPAFILEKVNVLKSEISKMFDNPVYSIDFGVENGINPYVFEFNNAVGFPRSTMKVKDMFIEKLTNRILN